MKKIKEQIIVGLDIGTTKICVFVSKLNAHKKLEIIGFGRAESHGVMRGEVFNIDKTTEAIKMAVAQAEAASGTTIKNVYVGIAGKHIQSMQNRAILTRGSNADVITNEEVENLRLDMFKMATNPGEKIIHVIPQEFSVDTEHGIQDPVGMCGNRLEGTFHIITGQIIAAQNIERSIIKAGLSMNGLILEPLASAASVLSLDELEAGVALVDIGGGTTDIVIYQDMKVRHTSVIPFGGNIITEDIKVGLGVMRKQAEKLKTDYGSALAIEASSDEVIRIPGLKGREAKEISVKNLANIIEARVEEIFEQVSFEIKQSGFANQLIGGIVLTGGGAQLKHLKQHVEYITGMDARIGYPIEHIEKSTKPEMKSPMYSTSLGLVLMGFDDIKNMEIEEEEEEIVQESAQVDYAEQNQVHHQHHQEPVHASDSQEEKLRKSKRTWLESIRGWFAADAMDFED
jgi:cell division protein FtsA